MNKKAADKTADKEVLLHFVEQFKQRDPLAFDEIYTRCYSHVLFLCEKILDSPQDAEEVTQDTHHPTLHSPI